MTRAVACAYARSLWSSGFTTLAIATACGLTDSMVRRAARREGWRRRTPVRPRAALNHRHPVAVRCGSCFAVFGDVAGPVRRPCPRCADAQLVLLGTARWTIVEARA
jgi:hypothetical protein